VKSVSEAATLPTSGELTFVPPNKTTYTNYDPFGRAGTITAPDGAVVSVTYKGVRETKRASTIATDTTSAAPIATVEKYDRYGRLFSVTENADGTSPLTTTYVYDPSDRLIKVLMPGENGVQERRFNYDYRGLLLSEQHPEIGSSGNGLVEYFNYDPRGKARERRIGTTGIEFGFDAAERITSVTDIGVSPNRLLEQYAYDDPIGATFAQCTGNRCNGKLAASARYNYPADLGMIAVADSYQYDGIGGRMSRQDRAISNSDLSSGGQPVFLGQEFFQTQTYDEFGAKSALTYPCRKVASACHGSERVRTIPFAYSNGALSGVGDYATITYQPNGLIDTVTHGAGSSAVREQWTADPNGMGRPRNVRALSAANAELWSTGNYSFDGSGNVRQMGNTSYAYDAQGRLVSWGTEIPGVSSEKINRFYDIYGNHLYSTLRSCTVSGDNTNCATSAGSSAEVVGTTNRFNHLTYDVRGNVLSGGIQAFTYDSMDAMTAATSGSAQFRYIYAVGGERVAAVERVSVSGNTRNRTTWTLRGFDNQLLSVWTDDATSGTRTFTWKEDEIWRGSQLLANETPSGRRHYILDHLGSPRLVTDNAGQVLGTQSFTPFGEGGTTNGGALQFTGHERDAANIGAGTIDLPDYFHARYYDQYWGRFLSVDPVLNQNLRAPGQWNRYSYAASNPLKYVDSDGRAISVAVKIQNRVAYVNVLLTVEIHRANGKRPTVSEFRTVLQGAAHILAGQYKDARGGSVRVTTTIDAIFTKSGGTDKSRHQLELLDEPATVNYKHSTVFGGDMSWMYEAAVSEKFIAHEFAHWLGIPDAPELDPRDPSPDPQRMVNLMDQVDESSTILTFDQWLVFMEKYRNKKLNRGISRQ